MIFDSITQLPAQDYLLLAVLFAIYIFVSGSAIHYIETESEYRQWSKEQPVKPSKKVAESPKTFSKVKKAQRKLRSVVGKALATQS